MLRVGIRRPRLLVVDDFRDGVEAISLFLSLSGYNVQYVLSGLEVATAVIACPPEIALLDINMPRMDGFSVAQHCGRTGRPGISSSLRSRLRMSLRSGKTGLWRVSTRTVRKAAASIPSCASLGRWVGWTKFESNAGGR
ncbi:response regulator transcription factor [Paraburkholderia sp. GAS199]|uniref:response regulator transcription factor n=1 Tax=Paraburkholderia sp. GAS199 TaxID=3035126 RepID=UPI003D1D2650